MVEWDVRGRVAEQHGEREGPLALPVDSRLAQPEFRDHYRGGLFVVKSAAYPVGEGGQTRSDLP